MRADALITERQAAAAAAATAAAAEPRPAQGGKGSAGAGRPRRAAILVVAAGPSGPVTGGVRLSVAAGLSFVLVFYTRTALGRWADPSRRLRG